MNLCIDLWCRLEREDSPRKTIKKWNSKLVEVGRVELPSYKSTIIGLYIFSILRVFFSGTDYFNYQMSHQSILCKTDKTLHILCSLVICNQRPYAANLTTVVWANILSVPVNLDVPFRYDYLDVLLPQICNQYQVTPMWH